MANLTVSLSFVFIPLISLYVFEWGMYKQTNDTKTTTINWFFRVSDYFPFFFFFFLSTNWFEKPRPLDSFQSQDNTCALSFQLIEGWEKKQAGFQTDGFLALLPPTPDLGQTGLIFWV